MCHRIPLLGCRPSAGRLSTDLPQQASIRIITCIAGLRGLAESIHNLTLNTRRIDVLELAKGWPSQTLVKPRIPTCQEAEWTLGRDDVRRENCTTEACGGLIAPEHSVVRISILHGQGRQRASLQPSMGLSAAGTSTHAWPSGRPVPTLSRQPTPKKNRLRTNSGVPEL